MRSSFSPPVSVPPELLRYVRDYGDDAGDGSLLKPWKTGQKLWDVMSVLGSGVIWGNFGVGNFGDIDFGSTAGATMYFLGAGSNGAVGTKLGTLKNEGAMLALIHLGANSVYINTVTTKKDGAGSGSIELHDCEIVTVDASGSDGVAVGDPGQGAGNILVYDGCSINNLLANGGLGAAGDGVTAGGAGSNGGFILVQGPSRVDTVISAVKGTGGADGGAGAGADGTDGNATFKQSAEVVVPALGANIFAAVGATVGGIFYIADLFQRLAGVDRMSFDTNGLRMAGSNFITCYQNGALIGGNRAFLIFDTGGGAKLKLSGDIGFTLNGTDVNNNDVFIRRTAASTLKVIASDDASVGILYLKPPTSNPGSGILWNNAGVASIGT